MLSRTAEDLYWMARYVERAENVARVLDVSHRMSLLPTATDSETLHWRPAVLTGSAPEDFEARYAEATADNVIRYMVLDRDNPSSIWCCVRAARENARADRTSISTEMWESLNSTWLDLRDLDELGFKRWGLRPFFDWVKERSHLFRGVSLGTMMRNDAFRFIRLGTFIERAAATARVLDVKYHVLLPGPEDVGGAADYYQWGAILRSVSAFRAYRNVYRNVITPWRVAELLILNSDMPRSLNHCFEHITETLDQLGDDKRLDCRKLSGEIHASLRFGKIDAIFKQGLHEFLEEFILCNNQLGGEIQRDFMMTDVVG